jgi:hypothetical protein
MVVYDDIKAARMKMTTDRSTDSPGTTGHYRSFVHLIRNVGYPTLLLMQRRHKDSHSTG